MLKELEDFAFRGCADVEIGKQKYSPVMGDNNKCDLDQQNERLKVLITHLKQQLEDLEKYAYEIGEGDLPSAEVIVRQV